MLSNIFKLEDIKTASIIQSGFGTFSEIFVYFSVFWHTLLLFLRFCTFCQPCQFLAYFIYFLIFRHSPQLNVQLLQALLCSHLVILFADSSKWDGQTKMTFYCYETGLKPVLYKNWKFQLNLQNIIFSKLISFFSSWYFFVF